MSGKQSDDLGEKTLAMPALGKIITSTSSVSVPPWKTCFGERIPCPNPRSRVRGRRPVLRGNRHGRHAIGEGTGPALVGAAAPGTMRDSRGDLLGLPGVACRGEAGVRGHRLHGVFPGPGR